jgi:hypothetical protein
VKDRILACDLNGEMDSYTVQGVLVENVRSYASSSMRPGWRDLSQALQSFPTTTACHGTWWSRMDAIRGSGEVKEAKAPGSLTQHAVLLAHVGGIRGWEDSAFILLDACIRREA